MSVDFLFQYSALELFWLLVPILIGIAVVETLAIYFFKLKGKNDFKEWILNMSMGVLSYPVNGIFAFITLGALFWAKEFQIYTFPFTLSALVLCFILDDLTFIYITGFVIDGDGAGDCIELTTLQKEWASMWVQDNHLQNTSLELECSKYHL